MMRGFGSIVAAAVLTASVATAAWAQPAGDSQAQQNVRQSEQYQQLVCSNASFRAKRMAQECGSLQGSSLYQSCVASFNCSGNAPVHPRALPPSEKIQ